MIFDFNVSYIANLTSVPIYRKINLTSRMRLNQWKYFQRKNDVNLYGRDHELYDYPEEMWIKGPHVHSYSTRSLSLGKSWYLF